MPKVSARAKAPARIRRPAIDRRERPAQMVSISQPLARPAQLLDDSAFAIALRDLLPGESFKTPDSPREGLAGIRGILIHANDCRARVRIEAGTRLVQCKNREGEIMREFSIDDGRLLDWSPTTQVIRAVQS